MKHKKEVIVGLSLGKKHTGYFLFRFHLMNIVMYRMLKWGSGQLMFLIPIEKQLLYRLWFVFPIDQMLKLYQKGLKAGHLIKQVFPCYRLSMKSPVKYRKPTKKVLHGKKR